MRSRLLPYQSENAVNGRWHVDFTILYARQHELVIYRWCVRFGLFDFKVGSRIEVSLYLSMLRSKNRFLFSNFHSTDHWLLTSGRKPPAIADPEAFSNSIYNLYF